MAASARALTWHAPTQAVFSKIVTSCYLRLADRGEYILLAMHNQQLRTNRNTFVMAGALSKFAIMGWCIAIWAQTLHALLKSKFDPERAKMCQ